MFCYITTFYDFLSKYPYNSNKPTFNKIQQKVKLKTDQYWKHLRGLQFTWKVETWRVYDYVRLACSSVYDPLIVDSDELQDELGAINIDLNMDGYGYTITTCTIS